MVLTNRVLKAFNEVQLTAGNFDSADGFSQEVKDSINAAVFDIHTEEDVKWPWAWNTGTITTTIGEQNYTKAATATAVDWRSFFIERNDSLDIDPDSLSELDYNIWRDQFKQRDSQLTTEDYSQPSQVVRKPNNGIIFTPVPDKAYTITYEYYSIPVALSEYNDETIIPSEFDQLIVDKALHYAYMFRDNVEQASLVNDRYKDNVDKVRRILIPQFENVVPR